MNTIKEFRVPYNPNFDIRTAPEFSSQFGYFFFSYVIYFVACITARQENTFSLVSDDMAMRTMSLLHRFDTAAGKLEYH
jgi:hypothetical protein